MNILETICGREPKKLFALAVLRKASDLLLGSIEDRPFNPERRLIWNCGSFLADFLKSGNVESFNSRRRVAIQVHDDLSNAENWIRDAGVELSEQFLRLREEILSLLDGAGIENLQALRQELAQEVSLFQILIGEAENVLDQIDELLDQN